MTNLIDRLETAKMGSRELDMLVREAAGFKEVRYLSDSGELHFTTSVDAALTMLPKYAGKPTISGGPRGWWVQFDDGENVYEVDAPTLPLALCIVFLKARRGFGNS